MHIWAVFDEKNVIDRLPVFCTCDTSRIATIPDELTDLSYVRKIIDELRHQVRDHTKVVTHLSGQQQKSCCSRKVLHWKDCESAGIRQMLPLVDTAPYGESSVNTNGHISADQPSHTSPDFNMASVSDVYSGASTNDASGSSQYGRNVSNSTQFSPNYSDAVRSHAPVAYNTEYMDSGFKPFVNRKRRRQPVIGNCRSLDLQFQGVATKCVFLFEQPAT